MLVDGGNVVDVVVVIVIIFIVVELVFNGIGLDVFSIVWDG